MRLASYINNLQVSQSITDGLKALRGDGDSRDKDRDRGSGRDRDRDRGKDRDRDERHGRWCLCDKLTISCQLT